MTSRVASIALPGGGTVSALVDAPARPRLGCVLAHGAGAGMQHPWLAEFAGLLVDRDVAVLRYNFPYMDAGRNRVDTPDQATATVRAAVAHAGQLWPALPLVAAGKSFGGRMTSEAQARAPLPGVVGLAFLGFPLHPPDKPGTTRGEHLERVHIPLLFLQGTRDEFAQLPLLQPVVERLHTARLHLVPDGDHSFKVRKSVAGRTQDAVMADLADTLVHWGQTLAAPAAR